MALRTLAALALLTTFACAQALPDESTQHPLGIDSGLVRNTASTSATIGMPDVVWSTVVTVPGAGWLRLHYDGVLLAGSRDRGGDGSFLRITSLTDGAVMTQHLRHVGEWQETSAYFNGDSVLVELLAHPGTGDNRIVLREASAGPAQPLGIDSICGSTDDRVLSNDPRVARNRPTGCTSWLIDDCQHCFLTAGHCTGNLQVVQFNVPLSNGSGQSQNPPPSDQYAVDPTSLQSNGGQGVGNDWAYFGVFANSTTGLTPFQANGGQVFALASTPPPVAGQSIRITGYGTVTAPVSPTWNVVQKTHADAYTSFTGTAVRYIADTTGGNSGSPVIVDGTNVAIGIHTHGGCSSTGGSNAGTGINLPALQSALANPQGICSCPGLEFVFPNGLPGFVRPDGSSRIQVVFSGGVGLLPGSLRFHFSTGSGFTVSTPTQVGPGAFEAVVPASACGGLASFYFSAQGQDQVSYTSPTGAPAALHTATVAEALTTIRDHDFQTTPPGWSVANTSLTTGSWVRATPADPRGPGADFDGSGACWVTGNASNEDVDGGPTVLSTEILDLSGATDPVVSYAIWFASVNGVVDTMTIRASNDGGASWTVVETVTPTSGWEPRTVEVRSLFPTPGLFAMRFEVADQPNDSVTEAALDAFRVVDGVCTPATWSAFGSGCSSGASAPALQLVTAPAIGGTFELTVTGLGGAPAIMVVGLGDLVLPLPQPEFAPGCTLYATPTVFDVLVGANTATWTLPIPNDPTLAGATIYQQAVEFGPAWTTSSGGAGEIR